MKTKFALYREGDYTLGNLTTGGTYVVTPLLANHAFLQSSTFSNLQMKKTKIMNNQSSNAEHIRIGSSIYNAISSFITLAALLILATVNPTNAQSLDPTFNPNADNNVETFAIQADGKVIVGGDFATMGGQPRTRIARLNADGSLDTAFNVNFTGNTIPYTVRTISIQADGKIIIGGSFIEIEGQVRNSAARLNANGSLDTTFVNPAISSVVYASAIQADGKIIIGGQFGQVGPALPMNGHFRPGIARLNSNGTLDSTFNTTGLSSVSSVRKLIIRPDGKIVIVGQFSFVSAQPRNNIALLNSDGSLDPDFNPNANGAVFALAGQADGKFVIGGSFTTVSGQSRVKAARLNSDGALDTTFVNPNAGSNTVAALAVQPDGKILVGGFFTTVGGQPRSNIARVNSNGSLDTDFNPNSVGAVLALAIQADGKILVGGGFTTIGGQPRNRIARFNSPVNVRARFDFDGDGKADVSVFRPSNGVWYLQQSTAGFTGVAFGANNDFITPADFDGDGKSDIAVFRQSNGVWYLQQSTAGFTGISFGANGDIPMPADYDGDGKSDIAVFRPSNGVWYIQQSTAGFIGVAFGANGDNPAAADYDGDGKADIAVFRPSNGVWYLQRSQLGFTGVAFGADGDKPVAADYDGDGRADIAVFRPSNGVWYLQQSTAGFGGFVFGAGTDLPVAADYDGDGKADIAVFRPSNGVWYLQRSTQGFTGIAFGANGDKPAPNAFVP